MRRYSLRRSLAGVAAITALAFLAALSPVHSADAEATKGEPEHFAPIDINKASVEGLTAIPGIGRTLAERIVAWREEHGPFRRVEDLMKVKGIGEKSFDKLRPYVKVTADR